jgi:Na+/melibiose symporter-like transporter
MTTFLSWRYGFACELIIIAFILIMQKKIPDFVPTESKSELDITGAIISFIGLVLLILGILSLSKNTNTSIAIIIVGVIVLAVFAWFESRRKRNGKIPLLDIDLFKDRNLRVGTIILILCYLIMGGGLFVVSLYLQSVLELNAFDTGLATLPLTVGLLIFSMLAPALTEKISHKKLMAIGSIIAIIGCLILSHQFRLDTTPLEILPGMFILGAGFGFIMALIVDIALANIPDESQNNASGITSIGESLGESMGTAIIGIILVLGIMGGVSDAVDMYVPEHSGDEAFESDVYDYFQNLDSVDTVKENSTVENILDTITQESMGFIMIVTAILMAIIFVLIVRLKDMKI